MDCTVVPPYSKQVLIGNWMDRRYVYDEKSNGILPGLSRSEQCEKHRSLSQDTYTDEGYKGDESKRYFVEKRVTRVRNFKTGTTSNFKLLEAVELKNNYTTTNTLVYELLPKLRLELGIKNQLPTAGRPEPPPELDMLQCFGNLTKTHNYAKLFKCNQKLADLTRMQTTYATSYNRSRKTA